MVRSLDLLCQRHLAADASDCFSAGKTVSFLETRDLCFAVGGDHDDFVDAFVYASFEEERDIVDDDGIGIPARGLSRQPGLLALDAGMNHSLKAAQFGLVVENDDA